MKLNTLSGILFSVSFALLACLTFGACENPPTPGGTPGTATPTPTPTPLPGSCFAAGPSLTTGTCRAKCPILARCQDCCRNTFSGDAQDQCLTQQCVGLPMAAVPRDPSTVYASIPASILRIVSVKGKMEELGSFIYSLNDENLQEVDFLLRTLTPQEERFFVRGFNVFLGEVEKSLKTWGASLNLDPAKPEDRFQIYMAWIRQENTNPSDGRATRLRTLSLR